MSDTVDYINDEITCLSVSDIYDRIVIYNLITVSIDRTIDEVLMCIDVSRAASRDVISHLADSPTLSTKQLERVDVT